MFYEENEYVENPPASVHPATHAIHHSGVISPSVVPAGIFVSISSIISGVINFIAFVLCQNDGFIKIRLKIP